MTNNSPTPCSLALDVTIDGLVDPEFIEYLDKHKITFKVLTWDGPGGGNPELEFYATREKLVDFLRDCYFAGDDQDVEYFSTFIVEQK